MRRFLEWVSYIFKHRIIVVGVAFAVLFTILVVHLFRIQIIHGSEYKADLSTSMERDVSTPAARGRIFDRNGNLLAYDELTYAVNISDSGYYSNKTEKNSTINATIMRTLDILKSYKVAYSNDFNMGYENGRGFYYKVTGDQLTAFIRDCLGVASVDDLTEEQKNLTAPQLADIMIDNYQIETEGISYDDLIELMYLRVNMTANSYSRYRSFTIANEISEDAMAAILEESGKLVGITVDENYVRRYNDAKYFAGILGYTGHISSTQLDKLKQTNDAYEASDFVGKGGVEEALESVLAGTKGQKRVSLDTVGHITNVLSSTDSLAGNDVYLTIDTELQKKLYDVIENKLTDIIIEHLRTSGEKFTYKEGGVLDQIYIMMPEVYQALLKNNIISLSSLQNPSCDLEKEINDIYQPRLNEVVHWLLNEMSGDGTPYEELTDPEKEYVWRAYEALITEGIIKSDDVDTNDDLVEEWNSGGKVKFKDLLNHFIAKGWIDITSFSKEHYNDMNDIYDALVVHTGELVRGDRTFSLYVYKFLIEDNSINGVQMCRLLYEQGYLKKEGELYELLSSGSVSGQEFISSALRSKILTPGELGVHPSSGGGIITDPYTGQLLAMVSYPGYDNNRITGDMDTKYFNTLQYNASSPMLNWATQAQCAPGSIFKLCTSIAALDTGAADDDDDVYCTGVYTDVSPSPKCWVFPDGHGTEVMSTAIRDSCNVFFYTMGNRIASSRDGVYDSDYGTEVLGDYARRLGLATDSGIEVAQAEPHVSDTNAIASAIGQGTASFSCVNISRYVSTIVTNGKCYNSNLILKTTDRDGKTLTESEPVVASTMDDVDESHWATVKYGMLLATDTYDALKDDPYGIACKTGTSQPSLYEPDNATYVSYAPYDDPEITLSIEIPFGYNSIYNTEMAAVFYKYYFDEYKNSSSENKEEGNSETEETYESY